MIDTTNARWLMEFFTPHEAHLHGVKEFYVSTETPFQKVDIVETYGYGKCLMLDGKMQSAKADEHIYHELLIHPAMITHPGPRRVFIVGGGEGATLREVLRYPTIEQVVMVDIDEQVVRLCEQHLPDWNQGAFRDPRTVLKFEDARKYLEMHDDRYDLIVIDITEPIEGGPSYMLFTKQFYELVNRRLTENGMISLQAATTNPVWIECHACIVKTLKEVFPIVRPYEAMVSSFDAIWGFAVASKQLDPVQLTGAEVDQRLAARGLTMLKYYEGPMHTKLFILPRYMREAYDTVGRVIEDHKPIFLPV